MSRLSIRTIERKKMPYGRFSFEIHLIRDNGNHTLHYCKSNASDIEAMRSILNENCGGRYKLRYVKNSTRRKIYTHLYMMNSMDVALLKLVHSDKFFKIYRIKLA